MEREETQRGRESRSQNQDMEVRAERNFVPKETTTERKMEQRLDQ